MSNIERALATIRTIKSLSPIAGADRIVLAKFEECGWQCIVNKGLYEIGSLVVFCEIDSWIPDAIAPFLTKSGQSPKEYNGVLGQRLKSIKMKGVLSQGLVLPLSVLGHEGIGSGYFVKCGDDPIVVNKEAGADCTKFLGIQKWEKLDVGGNGSYSKPAGSFPTHLVSKTDQERIQNFAGQVRLKIEKDGFLECEVTEKMDGSSMTMLVHDGEFMVCSRNQKLKEPEDGEDVSNFWKAALRYKDAIMELHNSTKKNFAIQGELTAYNIQGNPYKYSVGEVHFNAFDVFNIDSQEYLSSTDRLKMLDQLGIPSVPVLAPLYITRDDLTHVDDLCQYFLDIAEGKSVINSNVLREGLVFKSVTTPEFSFKSISSEWLLANDG